MKKKMLPSLCNLLGTLILLLVIVSCLPLTVPRLSGYEIYEIVSGSMEPEIPVGSVIYVKNVQPEDIEEEDVIAFWSGSTVIAHRVRQNKVVEGEFVTKGDANAAEDLRAVSYSELIGRVVYHFPVAGHLMALYTSNVGKIYVILFAACGVMLNMLAGCLRDR
ncbi:MAG: signal peptidase I [Lachnospiraceae bacterium]|nr:signal peptidase I [Lachnospiraceae bacterium]